MPYKNSPSDFGLILLQHVGSGHFVHLPLQEESGAICSVCIHYLVHAGYRCPSIANPNCMHDLEGKSWQITQKPPIHAALFNSSNDSTPLWAIEPPLTSLQSPLKLKNKHFSDSILIDTVISWFKKYPITKKVSNGELVLWFGGLRFWKVTPK